MEWALQGGSNWRMPCPPFTYSNLASVPIGLYAQRGATSTTLLDSGDRLYGATHTLCFAHVG